MGYIQNRKSIVFAVFTVMITFCIDSYSWPATSSSTFFEWLKNPGGSETIRTPLYFRSVESGNWNSVSTWETSTNNQSWTPAQHTPNHNDHSILIRSPHEIRTAGINNLTIDDLVISAGATLRNDKGTQLTIHDGITPVDLDVQGTFIDSSDYEVKWNPKSSWRLGVNATIVIATQTNNFEWQRRYFNNIISIPVTSNWIYRKPSGSSHEPVIPTSDDVTSEHQQYYGNLYIENYSQDWNGSKCNFSGSKNYPVIKGNLFIGGNGSGTVDFQITNSNSSPVKIYGDLIISAGSTLSALGTGISLEGNIQCNGNYTSVGSKSKLVFTGKKQQQNTGTGNISTHHMEVNKTSGDLSLRANLNVHGNLKLISGIVNTSDEAKIIIHDNGTTSNASDISYVKGPVQKRGDDAFIFPLGKSGSYKPLSMNAGINNLSTDAFTAEYFRMNPQLISGKNLSGLDSISVCEYWTLSMDIGSSQKNVTLNWDGNSCTISNLSDLRVARFNSTLWQSEGNLFTTGNSSSGSISSKPVSGYGQYTIGMVNATSSQPITLISFAAVYNGREVKLSWVTSSEINNEFFTIERSRDGKTFEPILTRPAAGVSDKLQYYGSEDLNPLSGITYYRLKQTDFNGKHTYSDVIPVRVNIAETQILSVQPSRSNGFIGFDINFPQATEGIIRIIDIHGKLAYGSKFNSGPQQKHFTIDASGMPTGVYFLQVIYGDKHIEKKFIY